MGWPKRMLISKTSPIYFSDKSNQASERCCGFLVSIGLFEFIDNLKELANTPIKRKFALDTLSSCVTHRPNKIGTVYKRSDRL